MSEKTRDSLEKALKGIIIALVILTFELGFIRNDLYEYLAWFFRQYSRTISISIAGILLAVGCMRLFGGVITEDEEGNTKVNSSSIVSFIVILLFAFFEIARIW